MKRKSLISIALLFALKQAAFSQEKLYPNTFPLSEVKLLDGPFKHAQELNVSTLLKYDADHLLAPYRKVAGLTPKAQNYGNWESDGLDGHIAGHYLSALAIHYASTGNAECKKRMDYMVSEFKACQVANGVKFPAWGIGYVGGVPKSSELWPEIKAGNMGPIWSNWVPWYNLHKTYAGLRDAWLYGGNVEAKAIFLRFCDWAVNLTSGLSDAKMEEMLGNEHGGMNEVFADAYQMTGNVKYLNTAKRFSHKMLFDAMSVQRDNLDNLHANTQVPKAVGFERIAEVSGDNAYATAGSFFWETVTGKRSLASGGNSRREFFPTASSGIDYVNMVEGPESCNTNNMLKLTEDLFRKLPLAKYADYCERALYNHILSTQHPEHGGYVYFTPARPRHYRVYSAPEKAMWCCVGTGMENHGKYGEFIYTHQHDSLFLNLFIASELNWKERGVKLRQETGFPYEEKTRLTVVKGSSKPFSLLVRYPSWVASGELKVMVNGTPVSITAQPSTYVAINRKWKTGDVVEVMLPMRNTVEPMPNVPSYIAFLHGPILLGAKTGTEELSGLVADDSRWAHIAGGKMLPVDKAPIIVEDDRAKLAEKLVPVAGKPLTYTFAGTNIVNSNSALELEPFYKIHDARYMMYWMNLSNNQYKQVLDTLAKAEAQKMELESRTVDFVQPGQQQPEVDHAVEKSNSFTGTHRDEFWRDARDGGSFSYNLATRREKELTLMVRYWGNDGGNRSFDILIDGVKLATENISEKWKVDDFRSMEYEIPAAMVQGKSKVKVTFQSKVGNTAGGIYFVRLLKKI
jgi:Uncharacterized protein conserved in bacteria